MSNPTTEKIFLGLVPRIFFVIVLKTAMFYGTIKLKKSSAVVCSNGYKGE
jgi:hypothetical protein